ncbi:hypothetical protein [Glycomyces buryatensis]|uniref:Uncharacterized protein n=1 Tax=Glycomyces buryatensis TaxID=2570927 RepID=A0A4S8Q355_9ACTN|nr:hypothetical protein [Glycomyces buryatensis]THV38440.1 hypothetical protein FAB82_18490 [Glycomyces buryatensis]
MSTVLDNRRYRYGLRIFTDVARSSRYWILGALFLCTAATAVTAQIWPGADFSIWGVAVSILQWFPAALGGVYLFTMLPIMISLGLTRREFTVAFAVFGILAALASALIAIAGALAEHAVLELVAEPLNTWGGDFAAGARYLMIAPIYTLGGMAVSALTIRIGNGSALLAAPLVLAALIYAGTLMIEFFEVTVNAHDWTFAAWIGSGLVALAALAAVYTLSLRSVPIRPKRA